ncbi:hypothetical protein QQX98_009154 [Neonectria punicea]|uniref:Uncharacterized protein n=1 Tax=Neonectria punicea TaxID=979145 RepID=A0ABR1GTK3_9HYPO
MGTALAEPKITRAWDEMELKDQTMAAWHTNEVHPLTLRLDGYHVELKALLSKLDDNMQILKQELMDDQANQAVTKFAVNDLLDRWKAFSNVLKVAAQGFELCLQQHTGEDTTHELLLETRQIDLTTKRLSSATFSFRWPPSRVELRDVVEKLCRSTEVLEAKAEKIFTNMDHLVTSTLPKNLSWSVMGIETATIECSDIEKRGDFITEDKMNESRDRLLTMLNEWALRRGFFEGTEH